MDRIDDGERADGEIGGGDSDTAREQTRRMPSEVHEGERHSVHEGEGTVCEGEGDRGGTPPIARPPAEEFLA